MTLVLVPGSAQLHRQVKPNRQSLFHPFAQTPRRARIEIHQFPVQFVQRLLAAT
jgi:hypothetical protein